MLFYRAALPLSPRALNLTARTIRVHRKNTRSRWRRLDPGQQALLVLVHPHKGETFAELAAGFQISLTTAWRYVRETTRLLAQQAPTLKQGLRRARRKGWGYVIVDSRSPGLRSGGSRQALLLGQAQTTRYEHPGRCSAKR